MNTGLKPFVRNLTMHGWGFLQRIRRVRAMPGRRGSPRAPTARIL